MTALKTTLVAAAAVAFTTPSFAQNFQGFGAPPQRYGTPSYGNPSYGNQRYGNPGYGNPGYGNPSYGNQRYGNPSYANPTYGSPNPGGQPRRNRQPDSFPFFGNR